MDKSPIDEPMAITSHDVEIGEARDYAIVQHNDLIQNARYKLEKNSGTALTITEQKILLYIISKIKPNAKELEPVIFDIKTFCEVAGMKATDGDNYKLLKAAITKLLSRVMWLYDSEAGTESNVRYIDRVIMQRRNGRVTIRLDDMLRPYLLNLASNYTQFSLHNILCMKSKYGVMLYQLLKSYAFKGPRLKFNIEDLKCRLDCLTYANFTNFKQKVINPALKDINNYTDLQVSAEYVKTGRSFTDIIFTMRDLDKSPRLEDREEAQRRYSNVEREIDPNQMTFDDFIGGGLL